VACRRAGSRDGLDDRRDDFEVIRHHEQQHYDNNKQQGKQQARRSAVTRILVVDDELHIRDITELMLRTEGYQVAQAHDGGQALKMVQHDLPDLILLDVMMPGISGYDVADRLKQDRRSAHIPIVFVSAKCEPEDMARGLQAGADFIRKPFGQQELLVHVRAVLRLHAMDQEIAQRQSRGM
jgi:DNA-binding response OmpR family regulator